MRRQTQHQSQWQIERSEENCSSSPSQILERVQPDRVTLTKPEEDRRRRTIIVEKKNGSYGFTLQSYGIHYKKEQEIEMITYVDYVDYDGPAYRSGMREGDVILSINGSDMEKSDHKTLVNFIKGCDTRMRMVVLFEDCVRKVELHIRYIQLQRILQNKMAELEKLCIRERQLMEGKWKTHSLPARKKAHQALTGDPPTPSQTAYSYCRPTVSTEDVAKAQHRQQNPPLILAYRYLDPHYRYMLQPSSSSSGEYLLTIDSSRQQNVIVKSHSDKTKHNKANQTTHDGNMEKAKKEPSTSSSTHHSYTGNLCNPCLQVTSNGDNTSLEAYDLASPCCDPHCVPTRRRSKHPKDHHRRKDSKSEETQTEPHQQQKQIRSRPHSQTSQTPPANHPYTGPRRYFHFGADLVSQCSLHSCTSSELSAVAPTTIGESSPSYTTSLSTDTLYWNGSCDTSSRQLSIKSANKHDYQQRYSQHHPQDTAIYVQYNSVKPKSWDNLATKAFGGYGFGGYGYIDTSVKCPGKPGSTRSNSTSSTKAPGTQYVRFDKQTVSSSGGSQPQYTPHTHRRYFQENKSTESLLSIPKYSKDALSDSSLSCECLEAALPVPDTAEDRFFQSPRQSVVSPTDPNFGYYSARKAPRNEYPKNVSTSSEATRL